MKKHIAGLMAKSPNCQQVMVYHQRVRGLSKDIRIATLKWEYLNMDFLIGFPRTWYISFNLRYSSPNDEVVPFNSRQHL